MSEVSSGKFSSIPTPETVSDNDKDIEVLGAIEKHLGLTPLQATLSFRLINHFIDNPTVEQIERDNNNVILGEFFWDENLPELIKNPDFVLEHYDQAYSDTKTQQTLGMNGSKKQMHDHFVLIKKILQEGKTFITTDAKDYFYANFSEKEEAGKLLSSIMLSAVTTGIGTGTIGAVTASTISKLKSEKTLTRRSFLKGSLGATIGIAASYLGLKGVTNPEEVVKVAEKTNFIEKPSYMNFEEARMVVRNKIMALNTWHAIERLASDQKKQLNLLFYAGNSHAKVRSEFLQDPHLLEENVRTYSRNLFTTALDTLLERKLEDNQIAQTIYNFAEMFSEPQAIGKTKFAISPAVGVSPRYTILSARDILNSQLDEQIDIVEDLGNTKKLAILQACKKTLQDQEIIETQNIQALEKDLKINQTTT